MLVFSVWHTDRYFELQAVLLNENVNFHTKKQCINQVENLIIKKTVARVKWCFDFAILRGHQPN